MHKEKRPFSAVLAMTLAVLQILLCIFPTISGTKVDYSNENYNEYDTETTSPLSMITLFHYAITQRSDQEKNEEEREDYYRRRYSSYYDSYYDEEDEEEEDEISTGSIYTYMILLVAMLAIALLFLVCGAMNGHNLKRHSLFLAISALLFVLTNLAAIIIIEDLTVYTLSDDTSLESGLTIFGWLSVIFAVVQWIICLTQKEPIPAYAPKATMTSTMMPPTMTPPVPPPAAPAYVPFSNFSPAIPAAQPPQPPQSRASASTITLPKIDMPQESEVCSACGATIPSGCRFCNQCGADLRPQ